MKAFSTLESQKFWEMGLCKPSRRPGLWPTLGEHKVILSYFQRFDRFHSWKLTYQQKFNYFPEWKKVLISHLGGGGEMHSTIVNFFC